MSISVSVYKDGTIQLPKHIFNKMNIYKEVEVSVTPKGILLIPKRNWQNVFKKKLMMKKSNLLDLSEVKLDDLWL